MQRTNIARILAFTLILVCTNVVAQSVPDGIGPWDVGRTTFTIVDADRDGRTFAVDVWYPVDPDDAVDVANSSYDLIFASIESPVALDGPPVSAQGPRPLIVFSHGSNGIRYQSFFLTEALASHGFVVAAPDHTGNTAADMVLGTQAPFAEILLDRPQDVSVVITAMLARNADPNDPFASRIDPVRIGVTGHSFGGYTAFAMAGANPDVPRDPRVQVIVPLAPATLGFTETDLAAIDLPTMILSGSMDITTPVDPNTTRPWEFLSSLNRYRADIIDGGHQSFTDICDIADALAAAGIPPDFTSFILGAVDEGCAPELIDIDEAHRLTRLYVTSFMKYYIAGERGYRHFLSPRYAVSEGLAVDYYEFPAVLRPGPLR